MRDVVADMTLSLERGGSSWTVDELVRLVFGGGCKLLIHDAGSLSWRWADLGRVEILHCAGEWTPDAEAWFRARIPDAVFTWESKRRGWRRFLQRKGVMR